MPNAHYSGTSYSSNSRSVYMEAVMKNTVCLLAKAVCVKCVFQSCQLLQQCRNVLLCLDCAECLVWIRASTISSWLGEKQVFPFREIRPDSAVWVFQRYALMVKYSDSAHNVSFTSIYVQWVLVDCCYTPVQASAGKLELHESKQHVLRTAVSTVSLSCTSLTR